VDKRKLKINATLVKKAGPEPQYKILAGEGEGVSNWWYLPLSRSLYAKGKKKAILAVGIQIHYTKVSGGKY